LDNAPELSPIECAKQGDFKLLADVIRNGSAEKRAAVADWIEAGELKDIRRKDALRAFEKFKRRVVAAHVLALERRGLRGNAVYDDVKADLGRCRGYAQAAEEYRNDPEVQRGILIPPWRSKFFSDALTRTDRSKRPAF
jgi:hypothetical protein